MEMDEPAKTGLLLSICNIKSKEYVCKVAHGIAQTKALIEDSFEYVTDMDGFKIFRKRK
jgi:hypothetical protein